MNLHAVSRMWDRLHFVTCWCRCAMHTHTKICKRICLCPLICKNTAPRQICVPGQISLEYKGHLSGYCCFPRYASLYMLRCCIVARYRLGLESCLPRSQRGSMHDQQRSLSMSFFHFIFSMSIFSKPNNIQTRLFTCKHDPPASIKPRLKSEWSKYGGQICVRQLSPAVELAVGIVTTMNLALRSQLCVSPARVCGALPSIPMPRLFLQVWSHPQVW